MQILTIIPGVIQDGYQHAVAIRMAAEQGCDPYKYFMAAAEFTSLGMVAAAQVCIKHASHYQELAGQHLYNQRWRPAPIVRNNDVISAGITGRNGDAEAKEITV
jgi:hypothetical protein